MADERSPLLQNGQVHDNEIDYSAVNEPEQVDSVAIHGSTDSDAEQQQTVIAPQNSIVALVRFGCLRDYVFYSNTAFGQQVIPMAIGIFLSAMDQTIIVACV